MQTAEYNHQDFALGREAEMDEQLLVRFFLKSRKNEEETLVQGRPIFKEAEYMEIRIPGSRSIQVSRPATPNDKLRFPRHYAAFKARVEMPEEGTPLAEWPQISRSMAEELSFLNIKTVEQLGSCSDTYITQLQGGYSLRTRAQEWLKSSDATALIAEKEALEARVAELEQRLSEFLDTAEAGDPPPAPVAEKEAATTSRRRRKKVDT